MLSICVSRNPVPRQHTYTAYLGIEPIEMHPNGMDAMPQPAKTKYYMIEGPSPIEARKNLVNKIEEDLEKLIVA